MTSGQGGRGRERGRTWGVIPSRIKFWMCNEMVREVMGGEMNRGER